MGLYFLKGEGEKEREIGKRRIERGRREREKGEEVERH